MKLSSNASNSIRHFGTGIASLGIILFLSNCNNADITESKSPSKMEGGSAAQIMGPTGHGLDYHLCAHEGENCMDAGYAAYGVGTSWVYKDKSLSGGFKCGISEFGTDPAPGQVKSCRIAPYKFLGNEGSSVYGAGNYVAYGAKGVFNFKVSSVSLNCDNATFGDPVPGVAKSCYVALPYYSFKAKEYQSFTTQDTSSIAFGANGSYNFKIVRGPTTLKCNVATFGDPLPGADKSCFVFSHTGGSLQNSSFTLPGNADYFTVYYTSGLNGDAESITAVPGTRISCTDAFIKFDPAYGSAKYCMYEARFVR
jgi:hypothetical protein